MTVVAANRGRWYIWVCFAVLIGYIILFNVIIMVFLTIFNRASFLIEPLIGFWL